MEKEFRVPTDGAVHALSFSGEMVPVGAVMDTPLFLHATHDAVTFTVVLDDDRATEHLFQVVGSGDPAPAGGRFIETVLGPDDELRWWHLFELTGEQT